MYVDKARNVNIGGRDLKTDVSPFDHDDHYRHHNILMDYYHSKKKLSIRCKSSGEGNSCAGNRTQLKKKTTSPFFNKSIKMIKMMMIT